MSNFIPRKFQNINTNEEVDFDRITKIHMQMPLGGTGFEKQHQSTLAVILGEPASGKTYQLKEYNNQHKETSLFIELVNLDDTLLITQDIDVVLIDSIDEALTDFSNPKKLQKKLVVFIKRCKTDNPKVRFIITCRFLEWNNIFASSLKDIDKELRVYSILELSKDDINYLLKQKNIKQDDFWNFIEQNYLESLLKNILVILSIIDRFDEYKTKQVTFIDIYHAIVKEYLSKKGDDREEIVSDTSINDLLQTASSLATYMTFNRKSSVDSSHLPTVASELYQVNGKDIVIDDLKVVLNTALFEKKGNEFSFFHQSIQEYLTAYFLAHKDLDEGKLKELLSSEMRFYEEFEEVVVYLTNIKTDLFDDFVKFDPFIFKRHPSLSKEQQEILLKAVLDKFENDEVQVWGRRKSFTGSTLVKFDKLDNLVDILKEHYTGNNANYYLMILFKNNYTKEFQDFIFNIFRQKLDDKNSLREFIRSNFVDNYAFNVELYDFMKENDLFIKDEHMLSMPFETELFCSLYGIKYQHGSERIVDRTDFEFLKLLDLLKYIPTTMFEYIAPYLTKKDANKWFEYLKEIYTNRQEDNYEYASWVLYTVLNNYSQKKELVEVVSFAKENLAYLHSHDKEKIKLNFQLIEKDFWELYFDSNLFDDFWNHNNIVLALYDIKLEDIQKVVEQYPIKDNLEKYVLFQPIKNVDDFLMQDDDFKKHMEDMWKKQEKQQRQRDEEFRRKYPKFADREKEEEKFLKNCIERFGTDDEKPTDYRDIFGYAYKNHYNSVTNIDKSLQDNLSEKYPEYIQRIKQKFKEDVLYKEIKNDLLSSTIFDDTRIYNYFFEILSDEELEEVIKTKKDYIKLFWHVYKKSFDSFSDKFIQLSKRYFDCFILLSLQTFQINIKQSDSEKIGPFNSIIHAFENLNKFDKDSMKPMVHYLTTNKSIIPKFKESYDKESLLKVLALDKNNYSYILELIASDNKNMSICTQYLLKIDANKALEDFYKIYNKEKRYRPLWIRWKNKIFQKIEVVNGYDRFDINPKKIELYKILISSTNFKNIDSKYIEAILTDYYDFFKKYVRPKGIYSPDIYDNMYYFINKRWEELENCSKYIKLLSKLKNSINKDLSDRAKYALTKAYESQEKEKSYTNSYYKRIFDMKDTNDSRTIINNGIYVEGDNKGKIKQNISNDNLNKKWYQKWWLYSAVSGLITTLGIWWSFGSLYYAIGGGIVSAFIIWKLNPKFRFRNIGYSLLLSGTLSNIIPFSGIITIPKNDLIHGVINLGENQYSLLLILLAIPFFILDLYENKR